jgi:SPP1 gp7 family putative phage head morphogenesis protein
MAFIARSTLPAERDRLAFDRAERSAREFRRARGAERRYASRLRGVAAQVGELVRGLFDPLDLRTADRIEDALDSYARTLDPWARAVARRMLADVSTFDADLWMRASREMGAALREEVLRAPTGAALFRALEEQVALITSLPREAARRVHRIAAESLSTGARAEEASREIMRMGSTTKARANLIARTEIGRARAELTRARAEHVGSAGYTWRTARDSDVRPLHRKLEGTWHAWGDPPVAGERGERAHPGSIYNCRCWPEVDVPAEWLGRAAAARKAA